MGLEFFFGDFRFNRRRRCWRGVGSGGRWGGGEGRIRANMMLRRLRVARGRSVDRCRPSRFVLIVAEVFFRDRVSYTRRPQIILGQNSLQQRTLQYTGTGQPTYRGNRAASVRVWIARQSPPADIIQRE